MLKCIIKFDIIVKLYKFNSNSHDKYKFAFNLMSTTIITNLFPLEVVQKSYTCALREIRRKLFCSPDEIEGIALNGRLIRPGGRHLIYVPETDKNTQWTIWLPKHSRVFISTWTCILKCVRSLSAVLQGIPCAKSSFFRNKPNRWCWWQWCICHKCLSKDFRHCVAHYSLQFKSLYVLVGWGRLLPKLVKIVICYRRNGTSTDLAFYCFSELWQNLNGTRLNEGW